MIAEVSGKATDEDESVESRAHARAACVGGRGNGRGGSLRFGVARLGRELLVK